MKLKNIDLILEEIKNLGVNLPKEGLLTGQAFSSLVLKYNGFNKYKEKKNLKINDIDVFVHIGYSQSEYETNIDGHTNLVHKNAPYCFHKKTTGKIVDSYMYFLEEYETAYTVRDSYSLGLLNITKVSFPNKDSYKKDPDPTIPTFYMNILSSFDMNNVQVGYDLNTGEFYYTKEFEDFFKSGQLSIVNIHSPGISLLRLIYKAKTFGFYTNLEKEKFKVGFIISRIKRYSFFSAKSLNKYSREMMSIENEFFVKEFFFHEFPQECYLHGTTQSTELFRLFSKNNESYDELFKILETIFLAHKDGKSIINLIDLYFNKSMKKINKLISFMKERKSKLRRLNGITYQGNDGRSSFKYCTEQHTKTAIKKFFIQRFFDENNLALNKLEQISKICAEHDLELFPLFMNNKLTYNQVLELGELFIELNKKHGPISIVPAKNFIQRHNIENPTLKELDSFVLEYIEKLRQEELCEQIFETFEKDGFIFEHITNGLRLEIEGQEMHHCVGGYAQEIRNNRYTIVSIKSKTNKAFNMTAEYTIGKLFQYRTKDLLITDTKSKRRSFILSQIKHVHNLNVKSSLVEMVQSTLREVLPYDTNEYLKKHLEYYESLSSEKEKESYLKEHSLTIKKDSIDISDDEIPF